MAWDFQRATPLMEQNLSLMHFLKLHPGTPEEKLPARFSWANFSTTFNDSAWKTALQNNITALMPSDEVRAETTFYQHLYDVAEAYNERFNVDVGLYLYDDPDPAHLSPAQIDHEIDQMTMALRKQFRYGVMLRRVTNVDPAFSGAPTLEYLISNVSHMTGSNRPDQQLYAKMLADIDDVNKPWPYDNPGNK